MAFKFWKYRFQLEDCGYERGPGSPLMSCLRFLNVKEGLYLLNLVEKLAGHDL
jgi:hypothetical protein